MKKIFVLAVIITVVACTSSLFAADGITPIKLSLVPNVCVPADNTVHGLDFGLLASKVQEVQGLQLSWFWSGTEKKMVGLQTALVDTGNAVEGVQWGFYNGAKNMNGLQLGFINVADNIKGLQVGLVNVIKKNGWFPVMVIVNGSF
jgi:hypothetical protein